MRSLVSGAVALAGLPAVAASANPGITIEPPTNVSWVRQMRRNGVISDSRKIHSSFRVNAREYYLTAQLPGTGESGEVYCHITEVGAGTDNSKTVHSGGATPKFEYTTQSERQGSSTAAFPENPIIADAKLFAKAISGLSWKPKVWSDDGEIVFEWINNDRHAVVSVEGDGILGYALLLDGQFTSGNEVEASVRSIPSDLLEYIIASA